ncbi:hypothetical protein DXG01_002385 [Tephrocybe rancida]|nr:hypothetical protein DXG01_002385 [Tephrocybe rancida]
MYTRNDSAWLGARAVTSDYVEIRPQASGLTEGLNVNTATEVLRVPQVYQRTIQTLRALAQDTFGVKLKRDWTAGVDMTPTWKNNALAQERQETATGGWKVAQSLSTPELELTQKKLKEGFIEGLDRLLNRRKVDETWPKIAVTGPTGTGIRSTLKEVPVQEQHEDIIDNKLEFENAQKDAQSSSTTEPPPFEQSTGDVRPTAWDEKATHLGQERCFEKELAGILEEHLGRERWEKGQYKKLEETRKKGARKREREEQEEHERAREERGRWQRRKEYTTEQDAHSTHEASSSRASLNHNSCFSSSTEPDLSDKEPTETLGRESPHPFPPVPHTVSVDTLSRLLFASDRPTGRSSPNPSQIWKPWPIQEDTPLPVRLGRRNSADSITSINSTSSAELRPSIVSREGIPPRIVSSLEGQAQESAILLKLNSIFADVTAMHYRRLLTCVGKDAQTVLDTFQSNPCHLGDSLIMHKLLDTNGFPDRGQLVVAMRRLSAKTQLYPLRYLIDGPVQLTHGYPVDSGKFADIYKGEFRGNIACLKVIRTHSVALVQHMAKIYAREAILWGQLSHPNLLPFYGLYTFRSQIALVAPWAANGNLSNCLAQQPKANRVLLCADAAAGVEYLHENGVVHGDIKAAFTGNAHFYEIAKETTVAFRIFRGDLPTRPPADDESWTKRGLNEGLWELLTDCWKMKPSERPRISAIRSRLNRQLPVEDPRLPGQWGPRFAMRFRNAEAASVAGQQSPSLADLDVILTKAMDDSSLPADVEPKQ